MKKVKSTNEIKLIIDDYLEKDWSPEQIVDGVFTAIVPVENLTFPVKRHEIVVKL